MTSYFTWIHTSLFILILFFMQKPVDAKVLIMTHCFNRPEFIAWQHATFKKFLEDEYEFVVFDDSPNEELAHQTEAVCEVLEVGYIRVPQSIHDGRRWGPSQECADTIQYMLDTVGFDYPGLVLLVDSDMFLIRDFSIEKYLGDYLLASTPQSRKGNSAEIIYLLPNLVFFKMNAIPDRRNLNFGMGWIDGIYTDTGGYTYLYLTQHPDFKWLHIDVGYQMSENPTFMQPDATAALKAKSKLWHLMTVQEFDYEFYVDYTFLHFRAGSNWYKMEESQMARKTQMLSEAMEELLSDIN